MPVDRNELWAELEQTGEEEVRARFVEGIYGHGKQPHVERWLGQKEQARKDALAREQMDIARSAAEAARDAAVAAQSTARASRTNNIIAIGALFIAIVSITISLGWLPEIAAIMGFD